MIALLAALVLAACDKRPKQWDAMIYPNANDLSKYEAIRGFKSFELCQQAAIGRIRSLHEPEDADYECGYMCGADPRYPGLNVCKETKK